jgi:chromosome segregation ATPase
MLSQVAQIWYSWASNHKAAATQKRESQEHAQTCRVLGQAQTESNNLAREKKQLDQKLSDELADRAGLMAEIRTYKQEISKLQLQLSDLQNSKKAAVSSPPAPEAASAKPQSAKPAAKASAGMDNAAAALRVQSMIRGWLTRRG